MEFLNHVAKWDTREMRTCGFVLASATLDSKDLCTALKCKEKLLNGEVVIYVDHERLLIKVSFEFVLMIIHSRSGLQ
jgi:hypothetical protein